MSHFFINRPIFAAVISVIVTLAGGIFVWSLPVAQYPDITPPTVKVSALYPGASADVVAETVATPIEQEVTGVEDMLYMNSQCTNDGGYSLAVTFKVGTDLDMAQVLVQNRVNLATPVLPAEIKATGVSVKKSSPSILLMVNLYSPDSSRDQLYLSNYASIRIKDELSKIDGVGDVLVGGERKYSMRIWLDPHRMAALNLTATDVIAALREQNIQVAAGALGQPPVASGEDFQYSLTTKGRLLTEDEFADIVVRTGSGGQIVRLSDVVTKTRQMDDRVVGGVQYGSQLETTDSRLDGEPSVALLVFQQPGSNALGAAEAIRAKMEELKQRFTPGVDYAIVYDTTPFIGESIQEVFNALRDAILLVAIVVLVFLQSWRAALVPLIAVPVAIIGTFAVMAAVGFSLNNLSMLGLVLAIGIVVDDAIVVVEAIEQKMSGGMSPQKASHAAMDEVSAPIIGISLVLMCVFIPCVFISGITGQFFRQFAVTIAAATFFSAVNSLTLSPALCALLLQDEDAKPDILTKWVNRLFGWFFNLFNKFFETASGAYGTVVGWLLRGSIIVLLVYVGLLFLTYERMVSTPMGFVPSQDKGYLIIDIQLPDSASIERTEEVAKQVNRLLLGDRAGKFVQNVGGEHSEHSHKEGEAHASDQASQALEMEIPGITHTATVIGQSFVQQTIAPNYATVFVILDSFHNRPTEDLRGPAITNKVRQLFAENIISGRTLVLGPPAVEGLGTGGGFKVMIRDIGQMGFSKLQSTATSFSGKGMQEPEIIAMFSGFSADVPQKFVDVDREKCKQMQVPLSEVFTGLQAYLGGYYVNDFNAFGRTWQVKLQADPEYRLREGDVGQIYVRNLNNQMVPLSAVASVKDSEGPVMVLRYNGYPAVGVNGVNAPGASMGTVISKVNHLSENDLPFGFDTQWTELTLLQIQAGNTALAVFGVAVVLVFLVLAAQYESLRLPFAVILVVPMCLLSSVIGIGMWHMDMNIFVQIGFVVLVGLASKNAILIVEFAKEKQAEGESRSEATLSACRLRLRPIIMTSLAFILGVVPLMLASGAGAEMREAIGVAVFNGMLGVTVFGIFLTPVFYYVLAPETVAPETSHEKDTNKTLGDEGFTSEAEPKVDSDSADVKQKSDNGETDNKRDQSGGDRRE